MLGHHWHASETLFKWCLAGGPMMVRLIISSTKKKKKKKKKKHSKNLTPSDITFFIRACVLAESKMLNAASDQCLYCTVFLQNILLKFE